MIHTRYAGLDSFQFGGETGSAAIVEASAPGLECKAPGAIFFMKCQSMLLLRLLQAVWFGTWGLLGRIVGLLFALLFAPLLATCF